MTRNALTATALAALLYVSPASADIIDAQLAQTQRCLHTVVQTVLSSQRGFDAAQATNQAVATCEPDFMSMMAHFRPNMDKATVHMRMIEEARRQLHIIVGDGL